MIKHFVEFYSPGTFVSEVSEKSIDSWDITEAKSIALIIKERHGATPYGFRFITRERKEDELDSKITNKSNMYYLGGTVVTREEIEARNDPTEEILRWNLKINDINRVIVNTNSYKTTLPLNDDDVVLDF